MCLVYMKKQVLHNIQPLSRTHKTARQESLWQIVNLKTGNPSLQTDICYFNCGCDIVIRLKILKTNSHWIKNGIAVLI